MGLRGGFWNPGSGVDTRILIGAHGRHRVIDQSEDFPIDQSAPLGPQLGRYLPAHSGDIRRDREGQMLADARERVAEAIEAHYDHFAEKLRANAAAISGQTSDGLRRWRESR